MHHFQLFYNLVFPHVYSRAFLAKNNSKTKQTYIYGFKNVAHNTKGWKVMSQRTWGHIKTSCKITCEGELRETVKGGAVREKSWAYKHFEAMVRVLNAIWSLTNVNKKQQVLLLYSHFHGW